MKWRLENYANNTRHMFLLTINEPFFWIAVVIACLVAMFLLGALRKHR